jgi:glutathione S-transferase
MALTLHHLNLSRSERIIWLLEELGADYELVRHSRDPQTMLAPADLLSIHPMGKAPLFVDGDHVIAESGAIALYLLEKFDPDNKLQASPGSANRGAFLEWLQASEGAIFLPFLMNTYLTATSLNDSLLAQWMAGERTKALGVVEARLSQNDFFAGDAFTAADIMMGFQLEALDARVGVADDSPIKGWLNRIRARDGYKAMRTITGAD